MACNCETQKQIDDLYRAYGDKSQLPENAGIKDYVRYYGGNSLAYILLLVCFPILLLYILVLLFWREDERIHVSDVNLINKFGFLKSS